jgi:hypothetical protein
VIIAGHIPYGVNEYDGSINWCPSYVDTYLDIIYPVRVVIASCVRVRVV